MVVLIKPAMTAVELDPVFVKALKLLQSKAKDSSAQLKYMLDDAIALRKGLKVPAQSGDHVDKTVLSKAKHDDDVKRKDGEKRSHDKSVKDPYEPEVKRSKFESSKQKDKDTKDKEKERERVKKDKEKKEREEAQRQKDKAEKEKKEKESATKQDSEIISDEEEPAQQMDAGDFARDLGIACVVCRQFDVSSGNQLVECQECHSLYHQECHKPAVTGQDVSDPRFVWYCSRCTKSFKKMMAQKPIKSSKPVAPLSTTAKESTSTTTKINKPESDSGSFRRIDPKAIVTPKDTGNLTSSSKAMVGLAGLAANLTKPRGESKNATSSKKTEHKGDSAKSSGKTEMKSSGSKQESSSKQSQSSSSSSSSKSEARKADSVKSSSKEDHRDSKKSDSKSSKTDDKKSNESTSRKEEKKEKEKGDSFVKSSKEDKKSDAIKSSPSHSGSSSSSPPAAPVSPVTPTDGTSSKNSSGSSSSSSSSNKQAVANLSMVTANKRMQMMKKKAQSQTKPQEKKVHIK